MEVLTPLLDLGHLMEMMGQDRRTLKMEILQPCLATCFISYSIPELLGCSGKAFSCLHFYPEKWGSLSNFAIQYWEGLLE
jgi:hypothetical protein